MHACGFMLTSERHFVGSILVLSLKVKYLCDRYLNCLLDVLNAHRHACTITQNYIGSAIYKTCMFIFKRFHLFISLLDSGDPATHFIKSRNCARSKPGGSGRTWRRWEVENRFSLFRYKLNDISTCRVAYCFELDI